jgi:uncharacterized membrane protein YgcG
MAKRAALIVATLLAVALFAAAGIAAALVLLGNDIFGPSVHALSQARVRQELAEQRSTPSSASPTSSLPGHRHSTPSVSPSSAAAEPTAKSFIGGTVYASCSAGQVLLTHRIPAPGYAIESVSPGPATSASVRFSSGGTDELVTVTCAGGQPSFAAATENAADNDNHGGGGGPAGGNGGNGKGKGGGGSGGGGDG